MQVVSAHLGGFMDIYRIDLSWSELDTLKASIVSTMGNLDKCHAMLNSRLDSPLTPEVYAEYLGYLANVSRDKANMSAILCKVGLSHE